MVNSYLVVSLVGLAIIGWGARFVSQHKHRMSEMCCMMNGMIFGMLTGFFVGAMSYFFTANYLYANILGVVVGTIAGIVIGKYGGPLSRMEGVMAGPMGGLMGAMFAQMISLYNMSVVMVFLIGIVMLITGETIYMMFRSVEITKKIDVGFTTVIALAIIVLVGFLNYPPVVGGEISGLAYASNNVKENALPFENVAPQAGEVKSTLSADGSTQTVDLKVGTYGYEPSTIILKKGVPTTLNVDVASGVGCGRTFVIRSLGVQKTFNIGQNTITFTPSNTGTIPFSCSMNMYRGTFKVV